MLVTWPDRAAIFAVAEPIIIRFESFEAKPYRCPAGKPTIGYGSTKYPDGRKVSMEDPACSEAEARVYMEYSMRRVLADLQNSGAVTRPPNANQAGAFVSIAYNVGLGVHDGHKGDLADSTLLECFNRGDLAGAGRHFLDWDKARDKKGVLHVLAGLVKRREAERDVFLMSA